MFKVTCLKDREGFCTIDQGVLRFWRVNNGDVEEIDFAAPDDSFELKIED